RRDGPELSAELDEHLVDQPGGEPHDDRYASPPIPPDATALDRLPRHEGHGRFHLPNTKRRDRPAVPVDGWPRPLNHGGPDAGRDDGRHGDPRLAARVDRLVRDPVHVPFNRRLQAADTNRMAEG